VVAVPRLISSLVGPGNYPLGSNVWGGGMVILPTRASKVWRNVFTNQIMKVRAVDGKKMLPLGQVFRDFPVALLAQSKIVPTKK
jgi:(1->4)-alpha-D-glucan 1-alpha-D-glucosylmutase